MAGEAGSGVRAAETVLQVLETVAYAREDLGVTQIAQRVGLTKSAVFRHLQSLVDRGYFVQDAATARYRLGPRARLLASRAPVGGDLAAAAEGPMRDLRDRTGFSVVLSTPTATSAFVYATLPGTSAIEIGVRQGSELALHASAQGKVLLACREGGPKRRAVSLPAFTPQTITDPAALARELDLVRARGWAVAPGEAVLGINALAVPVFDGSDALVAALAVVGSQQYLPADPEPALAADLIAAARAIGQRLG